MRSPRAVGDGGGGLENLSVWPWSEGFGGAKMYVGAVVVNTGEAPYENNLATDAPYRDYAAAALVEVARGRCEDAGRAGQLAQGWGRRIRASSAQPTTAHCEPREPTSLAQFRGRCRLSHESRYKRETPTVDAPVRGRCRWRVFTTTRRDAPNRDIPPHVFAV